MSVKKKPKVQRDTTGFKPYCEALTKRINQLEDKCATQEDYSRRHNVIIEGVQEYEGEDCYDIVADVCNRALGLPNMDAYIDKTHRVGPRREGATRAIIVRFLYHQDADRVLAKASIGRRAGLNIHADYSKDTLRERLQLEKVHRLAQRDGKTTRLVGSKLLYNRQVYSLDTIHGAGLNLSRISERKTGDQLRFYGRFSPLSNFHPVKLEYNDFLFSSAEQLYHFKRAEAINHHSLAVEISLAKDPVDCKHISKHIPEDRDRDMQIMQSVLRQKFALPRFRDYLAKTGKLAVIEANPHDAFWPAGCSLDGKSDGYKGSNHLGRILTEIRDSSR